MAVDALRACEVEDFRVELGHAGFYKALAGRLPVDDEVREDIRLLIESKNYAGLGALLDDLEDTEAVRWPSAAFPACSAGGRSLPARPRCAGKIERYGAFALPRGDLYRPGSAGP